MRFSRSPTMNATIALPAILFICYGIYVLKSSRPDLASPSPFTFQPVNYTPSFTLHSSNTPKASRLSPGELMARSPVTSQSHMPKLFHQSWSTTALPAHFEQWSLSCREMNPDFEWVLWTDEDNRRLVEKYAPEFLVRYDGLQSEIYRADAVRNLYMFVFGGVYADLDTECLRPYSDLFAGHDTSLMVHSDLVRSLDTAPESTPDTTSTPTRRTNSPGTAFLARMGTDNSKKHSIPNAWMASTPSHPFWLLPLNLVASDDRPYGDWPEAVTGPDALFYLVNEYLRKYSRDGNAQRRLKEHLQRSELRDVYLRSLDGQNFGAESGLREHQMVILGHEMIFPYWWGEKVLESVCRAGIKSFDPETCKDVLDVQALGSWSITYWSHSWSQKNGHDKGHLSAMESLVGFSGRRHPRA